MSDYGGGDDDVGLDQGGLEYVTTHELPIAIMG
jgi:hypothetical protein